jgi:integrase/recombinase XerD
VTGGLRRQAGDYLQMRHDLGYELDRPGRLVRQFAGWCDDAGITCVTSERALEWAMLPTGVASWYRWLRLSAVRGPRVRRLAARLRPSSPGPGRGPAALPAGPARSLPAVRGDVAALLAEAAGLRPAVHAATYQALIALAAAAGIRPCGAIRMNDEDIDPVALVLTVHGKNHKERRIPLHATTAAALAGYARLRDRELPRHEVPAFFVSTTGARLTPGRAAEVFAMLVSRAGLAPAGPGARRPVLNSLRHSFAVTALIGWLSDGTDVEASLPALSAWTGHKKPRSTYWYLQAVPELLQAASDYMARAAARLPGTRS